MKAGRVHLGTIMRTSGLLAVSIFLLYLTLRTQAYEARGYTDTSDGYCKGDFGKIPVGGIGYNDKRCVRILCGDGMYTIQGCGVVKVVGMPPNCHLVGKPGHYPKCCKTNMQCDNDNVESFDDNDGEDSNSMNGQDSNDNDDGDSDNNDDNDGDSNRKNSNDKNDEDSNGDDSTYSED